MAKYIVFEVTGERRCPKRNEAYIAPPMDVMTAGTNFSCNDYPILRRLTDEEVDALVKRDDERKRFVRDMAARMLPTVWARVAEQPNSGE